MVMGTLGIYTEMAQGKENGKRVSRLRWFALGCLAGVTGGVGDLCDWVAREWDRQRADRNLPTARRRLMRDISARFREQQFNRLLCRF
jgi:hypothetical protein